MPISRRLLPLPSEVVRNLLIQYQISIDRLQRGWRQRATDR